MLYDNGNRKEQNRTEQSRAEQSTPQHKKAEQYNLLDVQWRVSEAWQQ